MTDQFSPDLFTKRGNAFVKLTREQKTIEVYTALRAINHECFSGLENPSVNEFSMRFEQGDVFVTYAEGEYDPYDHQILAYAIVDTTGLNVTLWQIATLPRHRKLGYATVLLGEIEAAYQRKKAGIVLSVKADNVIAQILYLQNGYKVESVARRYFGSKYNGLLMRKEF